MPVKGYQGKIIRIKNPGGRLFSEALFVLREDAPHTDSGDMLTEANRILRENSLPPQKTALLFRPLPFLFGFIAASALWLTVLLTAFG